MGVTKAKDSAGGRYTDAVDDILLKAANAKQKKFKIIVQED